MADNLFDRVDELSSQMEELLRRQEQESQKEESFREEMRRTRQNTNVPRRQTNLPAAVRAFVHGSVQEFLWFGTRDDFRFKKRRLILYLALSIALMIANSVVSVIGFHLYTTFLLFENFCLWAMLFLFVYACRARKDEEAVFYEEHTYQSVTVNELGMIVVDGKKRRYRVFFILGYLGALLNVIGIWLEASVPLACLVTFFEVLSWGFVTFALYKNGDFFMRYEGLLRFSNIQVGATLYYDAIGQHVYREEDFYRRFPIMRPDVS